MVEAQLTTGTAEIRVFNVKSTYYLMTQFQTRREDSEVGADD